MGKVILFKSKTIIAGIVMANLVLTACAPQKTVIANISPAAIAAMGPDQDLTQVQRNRANCYMIQTEDELAGFLMPVRDSYGNNVCDE